MAEIPPAGGPADVSSMLDAWLAEDQGAVAGDWSPVEPGIAPASPEHPADATGTPPAADPLLDAAIAHRADAAGGWTPGDLASNAPRPIAEPSHEPPRPGPAEVLDAADPAWTPLTDFRPEPIEPAPAADAGPEAPSDSAWPASGRLAGAVDLPASDPALDAWVIDEQPPALSPWTLSETQSVAVPDASEPATLQAEPAAAIEAPAVERPDTWLDEEPRTAEWPSFAGVAAPPVAPSLEPERDVTADAPVPDSVQAEPAAIEAPAVEGHDAWLDTDQGAAERDWTPVEGAAGQAVAPPLEAEGDVMPHAPADDPVQAEPAVAIDASTGDGLDAWLNGEQAAVDGNWSSSEGAAAAAAAMAASDAVPTPPVQDRATHVEPPPPPSASLLEAVSAQDARAGEAAAPEPQPAGAAPDRAVEDRYVLFTVAGAQYAIQETFVTELDRVPKITAVPNVPVWVRGVTNRRGDILSVIEIRGLLGLERIAAANERMLVVRLLDDSCSLGMLVDTVQQIVTRAAEDVRPPAATLEGVLAPFMRGVFEFNGKAVAVLDLDRMLRSEPVRQFDEPPDADEG